MYKSLRKASLKSVLPRIIACAVVAAVLLALCGGGLLKLISGPVPLDTAEDMGGKYVSFDASEVVVAFANLTVKREDSSETLETYYLIPTGSDSYMAVVDYKDKNVSILDRAMEQSYAYYMKKTLDTKMQIGPLKGTVKPLDEDMISYMAECIDNYTLPGYEEGRDSGRLVVPYQVELNYAGFLQERVVVILAVAALVVLLLLALQLIVVFAGGYQKKVSAVLEGVTDEEYDKAIEIERIKVGRCIWYTAGPGSRAVLTENIIWGYAMPEPMVVSKYRWPVALYTKDQKQLRVNFMSKENCQKFLSAIAAQGHPFVEGYTSELAQIFQNAPEKFLTLAMENAKK